MKAIAWAIGLITLVTAAAYTAVSLARWEWSRALFFGLVFVAAEISLVAIALFARLARLESTLRQNPPAAAPAVDAVRQARNDHDRFPWLRIDPVDVVGRTNVFVTMLVGGGLLLSGGAWLIDRFASRTVDPPREARLGRQLDAIAYPGHLVVDDVVTIARTRPDRDDPRLSSFLGEQP